MYISPIDHASKLQYVTQLQKQTHMQTYGETIKPIADTDHWVGKNLLDGGTMYRASDTPLSIEAGPDAPTRDPNAKVRVYFNALSGRDYYLTQERAQSGAVADYFFELRPDDIAQQAKAIISGEGYDPYHPATEFFVKGLCQWFSEEDSKSVAKSFEDICHEYAEILETGRTPALSDLKTTFSLCGETVSVSELFNMVDVGKKIAEQDRKYGCIGTTMYIGLAAEGMLKSAALNYAQTLSSGVGEAFANNFTRLFDNSAKCSIQKWNEWNQAGIGDTLPQDYCSYVVDQGAYSYQLFSQSNLSSTDISNKIDQLCIRNQYAYGGVFTTDLRNIITSHYLEIVKLLT